MSSTVLTPLRFSILIFAVIITGMSQGLLLPLLSLLLEKQGISAAVNGWNAAALYLGTFASMFFVEKWVRRFGYKQMIAAGFVWIIAAACLFPVHQALWFWFILRIAVGIGDSMLHYSTQLWIVSSSPEHKRGRYIAYYGMSYAVGFSIGPLGMNLLKLSTWAPFIALAALLILASIGLLFLNNEYPEKTETGEGKLAAVHVKKVYRIAWFALLPSFMYGFMESTMNGNFPVYGLRMDFSETWISILLPAVGAGSLILQLPLGMLSDRFGRKKVLISAGLLGGLAFILVPVANGLILSFILLAVAGGFVGSFFSLGLAYAADILPKSLLPKASVIASIHFSLGSIAGPNIGGWGIGHVHPYSMFIILGSMYFIFAALGLISRESKKSNEGEFQSHDSVRL